MSRFVLSSREDKRLAGERGGAAVVSDGHIDNHKKKLKKCRRGSCLEILFGFVLLLFLSLSLSLSRLFSLLSRSRSFSRSISLSDYVSLSLYHSPFRCRFMFSSPASSLPPLTLSSLITESSLLHFQHLLPLFLPSSPCIRPRRQMRICLLAVHSNPDSAHSSKCPPPPSKSRKR